MVDLRDPSTSLQTNGLSYKALWSFDGHVTHWALMTEYSSRVLFGRGFLPNTPFGHRCWQAHKHVPHKLPLVDLDTGFGHLPKSHWQVPVNPIVGAWGSTSSSYFCGCTNANSRQCAALPQHTIWNTAHLGAFREIFRDSGRPGAWNAHHEPCWGVRR